MRLHLVLFASLILLLFPCVTHADLSADQWRADLAQMDANVREEHLEPFHSLAEAQWETLIERLHADIPNLSDSDIVVRLVAIVAAIGDGHTRLTLPRLQPLLGLRTGHSSTPEPNDPALRFHRLPVSFYIFAEGLFITEATEAHKELLGAQVLSFGSTPTSAAIGKISPLVHRDNEQGLKDMIPDRLAIPELLQATGISKNRNEVTLLVKDRSGKQRTVTLTPIVRDDMEWRRIPATGLLMLSHEKQRFWHEWLNGGEVLYVHLYEINDDDPRLLVPWFNQLLAEAVARGTQRLILDLRRNYGGDSSHNRGLVMAIKELGDFDLAGRTYVLIGRSTFSAAQNLVNDLEQWTRAILVGEPTGSRPGSYGDSRKILLQHSGLTVRVSTRYHDDWLGPVGRTASLPDLNVPLLASDWLAGNDTGLNTALKHQPASDPGAWYQQLLQASGFDHATIRLWQYRNDPLHAQEDFSGSLEAVTLDLIAQGQIDEAYYTALLLKNLFPTSAATASALAAAMKARGDD